jgi:dsRNA-specific ribonuclease
MEEQMEATWKKLEKKLGYVFKDKEILRQALTRESAIQEKVRNAAKKSFQGLEFVGDAAIKHAISRCLFEQYGEKWTAAQLHDETKRLIGNRDLLPKIADKLGLSKFIIRGRGEKDFTLDMKADMLEALIGAVSMDNKKQGGLLAVIERLWSPHLKKPEKVLEKKVEAKNSEAKKSVLAVNIAKPVVTPKPAAVPKPTQNASTAKVVAALTSPPSPRTQRLFTGTSTNVSVDQFRYYVKEAPDVNRLNVGNKGDTALMKLLRKGNLDRPKVQILLDAGASWAVQNKQGDTAESIAKAKKHNIAQFKK